jgi:uncharacterized protein (TIGR02246 family)
MTSKAASLVDQAKQWAANYGAYPNGTEGAVMTVPLRACAAWEANDAKEFAGLFTSDGSELIGDRQLQGAEEILEYLSEAFAGPYRGSRLSQQASEITMVTDELAVAVAEGAMLRDAESNPAPENRFRAVWVIVKQDGDWKVFAHQTSPLGG